MSSKLIIEGGGPLAGDFVVSGAKNAALPILFATLLTDEDCRLTRVPRLEDIRTTLRLMQLFGTQSEWSEEGLKLRTSKLASNEAPYDLVKTMRASILALGPLLARFGEARVSLPGGCSIGARPVNFHISALRKMGAEISIEEGYIHAKATRLKGATVPFRRKTVTGTENILMAACLADGETVIENAAQEPEIVDLALALRKMGADIAGEGSRTIRVVGKPRLHGFSHEICADRIEAGTFIAAAMATAGNLRLIGVPKEIILNLLSKSEEAGCTIQQDTSGIRVQAPRVLQPVDVCTQPYPGFPTDMQAQWMAAMLFAQGDSRVTEKVFENRFMHVAELRRMGAVIEEESSQVCIVRGRAHPIMGAPVMATDLRASACLVVAALNAQGRTTVDRIYHLDRGYENFEGKLQALGARVYRENHLTRSEGTTSLGPFREVQERV